MATLSLHLCYVVDLCTDSNVWFCYGNFEVNKNVWVGIVFGVISYVNVGNNQIEQFESVVKNFYIWLILLLIEKFCFASEASLNHPNVCVCVCLKRLEARSSSAQAFTANNKITLLRCSYDYVNIKISHKLHRTIIILGIINPKKL
ncbi:hypothetical protein NQ317_006039 [Molorchus minor]|uniref:Uncharacterized protein n=1 Tax=Molorchus minor TaxID=1323400 RepID=A0ABQ9K4U3_9CUCU|nr:hypothetical protein NQ317_006039 [Molorchus minor]